MRSVCSPDKDNSGTCRCRKGTCKANPLRAIKDLIAVDLFVDTYLTIEDCNRYLAAFMTTVAALGSRDKKYCAAVVLNISTIRTLMASYSTFSRDWASRSGYYYISLDVFIPFRLAQAGFDVGPDGMLRLDKEKCSSSDNSYWVYGPNHSIEELAQAAKTTRMTIDKLALSNGLTLKAYHTEFPHGTDDVSLRFVAFNILEVCFTIGKSPRLIPLPFLKEEMDLLGFTTLQENCIEALASAVNYDNFVYSDLVAPVKALVLQHPGIMINPLFNAQVQHFYHRNLLGSFTPNKISQPLSGSSFKVVENFQFSNTEHPQITRDPDCYNVLLFTFKGKTFRCVIPRVADNYSHCCLDELVQRSAPFQAFQEFVFNIPQVKTVDKRRPLAKTTQ